MTKQTGLAAGPAPRAIPRKLVMTFLADRTVRTGKGALPASQLRPGDRVLSGADAALSVIAVAVGDPPGPARPPLVRVVLAREATPGPAPLLPVAGRVSPADGRLHLN